MINVYHVLGVAATATDDDIKKAYRELSRALHPDHGGDPAKMAELNEAYNLINTPEKRFKYDHDNAFSATFKHWETIFGKSDVAANFGKKPTGDSKSTRGKDVLVNVEVTLEQFVNGDRFMVVEYDRRRECLECCGSGILIKNNCAVCGGTGKVRSITMDAIDRVSICPKCNGTGSVVKESCHECNGAGYTVKHATHSFTYRPFTTELTVVGKGDEGSYGGENGTLKITFSPKCPADSGITYRKGKFNKKLAIRPEDFILGCALDFDFGGKMVVITVKPGKTYRRMVKIDNVAGSGLPMTVDLTVDSETDASMASISAAMEGLRAARKQKMY